MNEDVERVTDLSDLECRIVLLILAASTIDNGKLAQHVRHVIDG